MRDMGGLARRAPVFATLFLIVTFGVLAMPGSSNFVAEFLILLGVFQSKIAYAILASAGVVMAATYALRLFIGAMHNRGSDRAESREISLRDSLVLVPLVVAILALALYPQVALHTSDRSTAAAVAPAQAVAGTSAEASR
jgi:NADH-quinone oxidoreductase subunit M